jgi:hypothetical protein
MSPVAMLERVGLIKNKKDENLRIYNYTKLSHKKQ